jgi:LuxR family transcriptional regulator, maltose regulon positive regulatory protein
MISSLLVSKLHQPALPAKQVQRPQLIKLLNEGLADDRALTLVSAPAGFGKTTCISEWIEGLGLPVAWLSLDKSDNDPARFLRYFLAALQRVEPVLGRDLQNVLASGELPPLEVITTHLINGILNTPDRFLLILDDFQVIQDHTILQVLEQLLTHQPYPLHLVIITREDPLLPIARLRANNRMTEIRAGDLRFNKAEAISFLNERMGLSLTSEDISILENRTEGWIAGLQLAGLSIRSQQNPSQFIANLSGSHRFILTYLLEEVLHQEPTEIQDFMLQTSILDRLNGDLCDAVTGQTGSKQLLEQLYYANLFLIPLDDEQNWYRYHHLFSDLLRNQQSRLPKEEISELHLRASRWYESIGMVSEAIEHALEGKHYTWAVLLLEKYAMQILSPGYAKTLEGWMQAIPEEFQNQNPKANLSFAWMQLLRGNYEKIPRYLKIIEPAVAQVDPDAVLEDENAKLLLAEWYAFQSNFLNVMGKPDESIACAHSALQYIPAENHYLLSLAYLGLGGSYRLKGDYTNLIASYQKAAHFSASSKNVLGEMLSVSAITIASIQYGHLKFAAKTGSEVIEHYQKSSGLPPPIMGTVYGSVGLVYYEWNQLEKTNQYFQISTQLAALVGHNAGIVYSGVNMSRLYQAQGDLTAAERAIKQAVHLLDFGAPAWLRPEAAVQQVRIYLSQHNPAAAGAMIDQSESAAPPHILLRLARLRLLHYLGTKNADQSALQKATDLANQLIEAGRQSQRMGIVLQALLLRAQMQPETGSQADMMQAIELAEPEGFIRTFLDEGPAIAHLLKRLPDFPKYRTYIHLLLRAFGEVNSSAVSTPKDETLIEALSDRELEVLRLIAQGMKYEEIAEALVITLNTVRFHVKQIYRKLDVNNRTNAIEIARHLDLL